MANKKYVLRALDNSNGDVYTNGNRSFERNLLNLSALDIKWNLSLIKQIRTDDSDMDNNVQMDSYGNITNMEEDVFLRRHASISGQNDFIAFYDKSYQMRRDFLRKFALQGEIDYVLETIADETIVNDDMHYFAYPNTKSLQAVLKKDKGKEVVDNINSAYKRIYHAFHFNESNDAWHYVKKFLIDGFLAFEIIYATDRNNKATNIIGFKELDATTLQPMIKTRSDGSEYKVWIINKGDKSRERELLDTNIIYISWARNNFITHLSYCERLIRTFNMLRTIENSRVIWNLQNAQKRTKIVVPVGTESYQKQRTRLKALEAMYKEDITIDNMSGEIAVNGQPKFTFAKTMIFPSKEGTTTEISELGVEGHDLNSTESLKWFWQRFIIESRLPKDRFNMFFDGQSISALPDDGTMTKEEYRFMLFIGRIRDIFQEILVKPAWLQFCLQMPDMAKNVILKNSFGLSYVEENIFTLSKEIAYLTKGATMVSTLSALKKSNGKDKFSMEFLTKKFLMFSDDDWALNEKLLAEEEAELANMQAGGAPAAGGAPGGGMDMGGMDMGDMDTGGMDMGGMDMGSGETAEPEPAPEPEPAAEEPVRSPE